MISCLTVGICLEAGVPVGSPGVRSLELLDVPCGNSIVEESKEHGRSVRNLTVGVGRGRKVSRALGGAKGVMAGPRRNMGLAEAVDIRVAALCEPWGLSFRLVHLEPRRALPADKQASSLQRWYLAWHPSSEQGVS
jgi:hypothetical protein